jgi:hypothetical protein
MPAYKYVNVTCYCGKVYDRMVVGQSLKCSCGITLHTQQKKHGSGKAWGTVKNKEKRREVLRLISSGKSKLDSQFV